MATTTNFTVTKDARIARRESDNYDSGAGTGAGLAFGLYSGYRYRALLGFNVNFAGWTSIVSAVFNYKTSDQINVAFGSDPTMLIQRITSAWSEGTQAALSASNAVIYPGPSATATNQVQEDAPTGENTWGAADITNILRDAMTVGVFHGIRILGSTNASVESDSAANVGEIYSREGGSDAYITITYETNRAPNPPVISSVDVVGGVCASQTPTIKVDVSDPDTGDLIDNIHWQIATDPGFTAIVQDVFVPGLTIPNTGGSINVVPAALTRGVTYHFRASAADGSVWGPNSATFQFTVASTPVLTVTDPSASGRLARLVYDAGSGWASPRMVVNWGFTCPDGGTQSSYRVEVFGDSAGAMGSLLNDSGTLPEAATRTRTVPANLTEGAYYHVRVTATCSHGMTVVAGVLRVRARWGVVTHRFDMGAAPSSLALTTLSVTDETTGGSGKAVVEYMTTTGTGAPGSWAGTIGAAGLNRYFWYRAWLLVWGASPAVSPTLNELKVTYSLSTIVPDKWGFQDPANASGDVSAFVYGTKSLRMKGKGSFYSCYQLVPVVPNTQYILSGRIQTQGETGAGIVISTGPTGGAVAASPAQLADIEFEDPRSRVATPVWNSGNNTAIYVRCSMNGAVGTTAWFDAIKLEASAVVTPWTPGYVAPAVVLDAGGLSIDAANGGIFRLRGSNGGARDEVSLGASGLRLADIDISSPRTKALYLPPGVDLFSGGVNASGAGGGTAGYWCKVAHGSLPAQYWAVNAIGTAFMGGSNGATSTAAALVSVNMYQGDVLGTQPWVHVRVLPAGDFAPSDFKVVVTSATGGGTNWELWMRSPWPWFTPYFKVHQVVGGDGAGLWITDDGWPLQAASSAGTAYIGQHWVPDGGKGTAFPTPLFSGQRFYRTDLRMEFFYDGARWLTSQLFTLPITEQPVVTPLTVNGSFRIGFPHPTMSVWVEQFWASTFVASGNSGSAYWTLTLTGGKVLSTISNANAAVVIESIQCDMQINPASGWFQMDCAKVGAPGGLYPAAMMNYRLIGT